MGCQRRQGAGGAGRAAAARAVTRGRGSRAGFQSCGESSGEAEERQVDKEEALCFAEVLRSAWARPPQALIWLAEQKIK